MRFFLMLAKSFNNEQYQHTYFLLEISDLTQIILSKIYSLLVMTFDEITACIKYLFTY
jgi:hypothetical protein